MNLGGKQGLDALLKDWPAPFLGGDKAVSAQDDERMWDERADAIVKAALDKKGASGELDALFVAPSLAPEAGEASEDGVVLLSGEKKMSDDKETGASPPPSIPAPAGERKRTSLKEIAARASQSGARPSSPGTPPPSSVAPSKLSTNLPGAQARPSTATPLPRPVEAGKDDSGVINLNVVRASATAQQEAAAEKAQPGQAGLFEDDKTVESAVNPAQQAILAKPTKVAVISAKRSNAGPIAGAAIAVLGIAAAFAIISRKQPAATPVAADTRPAAVATAAPTLAPPAAPARVANAEPTAQATAAAEAAPTAEAAKAPDPSRGAVASGPATPAGTAAPGKDAPAEGKLAASGPPAATGKPGNLQDEMAKAVGPVKDGENPANGPAPEPAAARPSNQNIPEQPSQGSVQAAIGTVMGGAKACVSGADDISRAQVTFSSAGTVSSVTVTGWAAAHGKSACVQAALKGAKVGAFSKLSFTVGVPIRP